MTNNARTLVQSIAKNIVDAALEQMATQACVQVGVIASTIMADPAGSTAKRFAELVACGTRNIDAIIESARSGRAITAAELK